MADYISKVTYFGTTLMDISEDTVTAADVASGKTFHDSSGTPRQGTSTYNADTSGDTVASADLLAGKTAHNAAGTEITGSMANRGAGGGTITTAAQSVPIQEGYHNGSGSVAIAASEQAKLIAGNIREGVTLLGVEGTHSDTGGMSAQAKSVTPGFTERTLQPDSGYNCLSQVTVAPIPVEITENAAGGNTVTIG